MKTTRTRIGAALALVAALLAMPAHAYDFNTVLVSGRPPGDPLGPQLDDPSIDFAGGGATPANRFNVAYWSVNALGQVLARQSLAPFTSGGPIYRWTNGTKELIVREGSQAIGMPEGVIINSVGAWPSIGDDGAILFGATFADGSGGVHSGNDTAYMLAPADGPAAPLAREGGNVPGIPGAAFGQTSGTPDTTTNFVPGSNQIAFQSGMVGPAVTPGVDNFAFFMGTRDNYGVYLRGGDSAPHVGPGVTYSVGVQGPWMVAGDYFVFGAAMNTPDATNVSMLHYKNAAGELSVLAKNGDIVPGTTSTFNSFHSAGLNSSGKAVFGSSTQPSSRVGIFSGTPGNLKTLALGGLPAPDTGGATFISTTFTQIPDRGFQLTESGAVAFAFRLATGGSITSANDSGIWIDDENGTRLAFREGAPAGPLAGVNIGAFSGTGAGFENSLRGFAFNDNQNLVVLSALTGDVTSLNNEALWLVRPDGELELILRKGDFFDVDPSAGVDERQISGIRLRGITGNNGHGWAAHRYIFNDNNILAFGLDFTDGTAGIFVTDLSPIPEPSTLALVGLAIGGLAPRRRRLPTTNNKPLPPH